jgi:hypothetical protein
MRRPYATVTTAKPGPVNSIAADERLAEVGEILARGLIRLLSEKSSPLSADCRDSLVDLLADRSSHAAPTNREKV